VPKVKPTPIALKISEGKALTKVLRISGVFLGKKEVRKLG